MIQIEKLFIEIKNSKLLPPVSIMSIYETKFPLTSFIFCNLSWCQISGTLICCCSQEIFLTRAVCQYQIKHDLKQIRRVIQYGREQIYHWFFQCIFHSAFEQVNVNVLAPRKHKLCKNKSG